MHYVLQNINSILVSRQKAAQATNQAWLRGNVNSILLPATPASSKTSHSGLPVTRLITVFIVKICASPDTLQKMNSNKPWVQSADRFVHPSKHAAIQVHQTHGVDPIWAKKLYTHRGTCARSLNRLYIWRRGMEWNTDTGMLVEFLSTVSKCFSPMLASLASQFRKFLLEPY